MSYRASSTTSSEISPHEAMFARPFRFAIDWSLATPPAIASYPPAYAADIKPKLEILSYLAMENSSENASKQRQVANEGVQLPKYQIGDKV